MGCHTWFYKKIPTVDYEVAKKYTINKLKNSIKLYKQLLITPSRIELESIKNDISIEEFLNHHGNIEFLEAYPELTKEKCQWFIDVELRRIKKIKKDLCRCAVMDKYGHKDLLTIFVKGKGHYASFRDLPHDLFRCSSYPKVQLFSLKETLEFVLDEENKCYLFYDRKAKMFSNSDLNSDFFIRSFNLLKEFWQENPNGLIQFG